MNVMIRDKADSLIPMVSSAESLVENIGIWAPVIVERLEEKLYLEGLCLMLGKDHRNYILLDGVDENHLDTPPTWVRIPHLG